MATATKNAPLKVKPGLFRVIHGSHIESNPDKPIKEMVFDAKQGKDVEVIVGYEERMFQARPDGTGGFIPSEPFQSFGDLHKWPEKFQAVFQPDGTNDVGRVEIPINAEVFDPARETIEAFATRMKAKAPTQSPSAPTTNRPTLEGMDVRALVTYAEAEEIDVKGIDLKHGTAKAKLIEKIKFAMG